MVEGSSLILNCTFQADPEPSVQWHRGGNTLPFSDKYQRTNKFVSYLSIGYSEHTLTVSNIGKSDAGNYTCIASNSYGTNLVAETVEVIGEYIKRVKCQ